MADRTGPDRDDLHRMPDHFEAFLRGFGRRHEGVATSPDGMVRARVRITGECQIRLSPREADPVEIEDEIRLTFNSAVRRMSRNLAKSPQVARFTDPEHGGPNADRRP